MRTRCLARLEHVNLEGPRYEPIDFPPQPDRSNGSLADDCAAIACLLRSGEPFLIGRPSMGSEIRAAYSTYVLGEDSPEMSALSRVAGVVVSRDATASAYGRAYGEAIARSDLAGVPLAMRASWLALGRRVDG